MAQDPFSEMMGAWKKASDEFLATWGKSLEQAAATPEGEAAVQQATKTYLGIRAAMADAAKNAYGPVIEAVGAVPLSEFQRLADQVQTVLMRLDKIDDALSALAGQPQATPRPAANGAARGAGKRKDRPEKPAARAKKG